MDASLIQNQIHQEQRVPLWPSYIEQSNLTIRRSRLCYVTLNTKLSI